MEVSLQLPERGRGLLQRENRPHLWRDPDSPLGLAVASRRFLEWTYLPILPDRERTLRDCIREGVQQKAWAVAIDDSPSSSYQQLIETPELREPVIALFDGSAGLVKGAYLKLVREQFGEAATPRGA